jgi:alpha-ribazole phosphatase
MRLFLARHTQPEGGDVWTILGHKDTPLSVEGRRHWEDLAAQFDGVPIEAVYSSDLSRAWWCADLVASRRRLPAYRLKELREMDCGKLDGMTREEAATRHPEAVEGLRADPANYCIPGGESLQEVSRRVLPVIREIRAGGSGCVLIVAHAVVNRAIICDALKLPLDYAYRIDQSYGGITIVDYRASNPILHTINAPCVPARFREAVS